MTTMKFPFYDGLLVEPPHDPEDIAQLRRWVSSQPHLPDLTDEHLHLFFHSNYCHVERTKHVIETYFNIRTQSEFLFSKRDPMEPAIQNMMDTVSMIKSSKLTPEGYSIFMYRLADFDASKFDYNLTMRMGFMFEDMVMSEDGLAPGYVTIIDFKGVTLRHLFKISISSIKVAMSYIQEGHPIRLKAVHVINSGFILETMLMLFKPFIHGELMSLLHFHGSVETIDKFVPMECLPSDYGSDCKADYTNVVRAKYRKMMETRYVPWFEAENNLRIDETKRALKSQSAK